MITEATFVACGLIGSQTDQDKIIENAMFAAVQQAQAEGITDPEEIRRRILKARDDAY